MHSENSNIVSLNNAANDRNDSNGGEIVNQTLIARVSAGSTTILKTDTTMSALAGAIIENGVKGGTVEFRSIFTK